MMNQGILRVILDKNTQKSPDQGSPSCGDSSDYKVHLLPCHIHWDGSADVSKYFNVRSTPGFQ